MRYVFTSKAILGRGQPGLMRWFSKIHLISPGCTRPSMALLVQNRGQNTNRLCVQVSWMELMWQCSVNLYIETVKGDVCNCTRSVSFHFKAIDLLYVTIFCSHPREVLSISPPPLSLIHTFTLPLSQSLSISLTHTVSLLSLNICQSLSISVNLSQYLSISLSHTHTHSISRSAFCDISITNPCSLQKNVHK